MINGERIFLLALVICVGALMLTGIAFYRYDWEVMRFPAMAGAATIPLCVLALFRPGAGENASAAAEGMTGLAFGTVLPVVRQIAVAAPLIILFGYVLGLSLYLFYHLRRNGESWRLSGALAVSALVFIQLVFVIALERPLAGGLLGLTL